MEVASLVATARELFARYDDEQAADLLARIPRSQWTDAIQALDDEVRARRDEVNSLVQELKEIIASREIDDAELPLERLLEICPVHPYGKRLKGLLETYRAIPKARRRYRFDSEGSLVEAQAASSWGLLLGLAIIVAAAATGWQLLKSRGVPVAVQLPGELRRRPNLKLNIAAKAGVAPVDMSIQLANADVTVTLMPGEYLYELYDGATRLLGPVRIEVHANLPNLIDIPMPMLAIDQSIAAPADFLEKQPPDPAPPVANAAPPPAMPRVNPQAPAVEPFVPSPLPIAAAPPAQEKGVSPQSAAGTSKPLFNPNHREGLWPEDMPLNALFNECGSSLSRKRGFDGILFAFMPKSRTRTNLDEFSSALQAHPEVEGLIWFACQADRKFVKGLETTGIRYVSIDFQSGKEGLMLLQFPNLRGVELMLDWRKQDFRDSDTVPLQKMPDLQRFSIYGGPAKSGFKGLLLGELPNPDGLRSLTIDANTVRPAMASAIGRFTGLQELKIRPGPSTPVVSKGEEPPPEAPVTLPPSPGLKVLHLERISVEPASWPRLAEYTQIEELTLLRTTRKQDEVSVDLPATTRLKRLHLYGFPVSDLSWANLEQCPSLEHLDVSGVGLTSERKKWLAALRNVKTIKIDGVYSRKDRASAN